MPNTVLILKIFLDILISFIENYLLLSLLGIFFIEQNKLKPIIAMFFTIVSTAVNYYFYPPILSSLSLLCLIYGYTFIFLKGKLKSKIIIPLLVFANLFIINITINLISILFSVNPENFISILNFEYFAISIFQKLILFFEYMYLKKYIHHDIYLTNNLWLLCISLVGISMIFPIIFFSQYLNGDIKDFFIVSASLFEFIIINILVYNILEKTSKDYRKITEQQLLIETKKYEDQMYNFIEERIKELNKINHDMNNHILIIKKLSENKKNSELDDYIHSIFSNITDTYVNTSNHILDYLLNDKIKIAHNFKIDVKCLIQGNLKKTISPIDLSIVIGNLLDNAIEGAKKSHDKYININIVQNDYMLTISVTNSFNGEIKKKNNVLLSSKPYNNHGYGISNIQQVCEKYDGDNFINIDGNKFSHTCIFILTYETSKT